MEERIQIVYARYNSQLNDRQLRVIRRLFESGHTGFKGGLSSKNYVKIAKTSESTATRDLNDLAQKGVLIKTGTFKSTRYFLNLKKHLKD